MQIHPTTDSDRRQRRVRPAPSSSQKAGASASFHSILSEVLPLENEGNRSLNELWQELPVVEKKLLATLNDRNLASYRQVVIAIARQTLAKNTRPKKLFKQTRRGERQELTILEVIDERLQQMVTLMHSRNNSAFSLFKAIEEIRGLLLDERK